MTNPDPSVGFDMPRAGELGKEADPVPTSTVLPLDEEGTSIADCAACGEPIPTGSMYMGFPEGFYHSPVCVNRRVLS